MCTRIKLLGLLFILSSMPTAFAQPRITGIWRSSDAGGNFVQVAAEDCDYTDGSNQCPALGGDNRYFWFMGGSYQSQWDNQKKIYIFYTSYDYAVYVYPNESLNPNNHYCYATSYASGSIDIWNKKPQINGCQNIENQGPDRCMQAYVVTSEPDFKWYEKISGQWQLTEREMCPSTPETGSSHLFAANAPCREFKVEVWNPSNVSGSKSYAIFWCMNGSSCSSCLGGYTIYNQY